MKNHDNWIEKYGGTGLWPVKVDGKWGYFSPLSGLVIEARYESVFPFSEGLAVVRLEEWDFEARRPPLYAVINAIGETVIPPFREMAASSFSNGLMCVMSHDGKSLIEYYLDKAGRNPFGCTFRSAGDFSDERACVRIDDLCGFIDPRGEMVIPPRFAGCKGRFSDGYALVEEPGGAGAGIINTRGDYVLGPMKELKYGLSEGVAVVRSAKGFYFIGLNGEPVFDGLFFATGPGMFKEGMAAYLLEEDGLIGFISRDGGRYEPRYIQLSDFSEGLCSVEFPCGRKAYINKKCEEVIDASDYTMACAFEGGLAAVWMGKKLGYINMRGELIWEPCE